MLVISRKERESLTIEPAEGVDPTLTLQDAFARGAIVVKLVHVGLHRVRLAISAPPELRISRGSEPSADADQSANPEGAPSSTAPLAAATAQPEVDRAAPNRGSVTC